MTHENGSDTMVMLISIPVIYGSVRNGARIRFRCQNIMMVPRLLGLTSRFSKLPNMGIVPPKKIRSSSLLDAV